MLNDKTMNKNEITERLLNVITLLLHWITLL